MSERCCAESPCVPFMKREHVQEGLSGVWIHTPSLGSVNALHGSQERQIPKYPTRTTVPGDGDMAAR
jgi:hypothetical protein